MVNSTKSIWLSLLDSLAVITLKFLRNDGLAVYNLLRGSDYDNLPSTKNQIFSYLEEIARGRLNEIIEKTEDQNYYNSSVRNQYIGEIEGLIAALGLDFKSTILDAENFNEFESFLRDVSNLSVRLRIADKFSEGASELQFSLATKERIKMLLQKLKTEINESNIDDKKKNRLASKIQNLEDDLSSDRTNLSTVMIVAAAVSVAIGGGTEFLANAPDALQTLGKIIEHVGIDVEKADEFKSSLEAEQKRLGAPPFQPALLAPPKAAIKREPPNIEDDDIPF